MGVPSLVRALSMQSERDRDIARKLAASHSFPPRQWLVDLISPIVLGLLGQVGAG